MFPNHLAKDLQVLGLTPTATLHEVRVTFRTLANEHHPDKFSSDTFSEADRARQQATFIAIREAYTRIINGASYTDSSTQTSGHSPQRPSISRPLSDRDFQLLMIFNSQTTTSLLDDLNKWPYGDRETSDILFISAMHVYVGKCLFVSDNNSLFNFLSFPQITPDVSERIALSLLDMVTAGQVYDIQLLRQIRNLSDGFIKRGLATVFQLAGSPSDPVNNYIEELLRKAAQQAISKRHRADVIRKSSDHFEAAHVTQLLEPLLGEISEEDRLAIAEFYIKNFRVLLRPDDAYELEHYFAEHGTRLPDTMTFQKTVEYIDITLDTTLPQAASLWHVYNSLQVPEYLALKGMETQYGRRRDLLKMDTFRRPEVRVAFIKKMLKENPEETTEKILHEVIKNEKGYFNEENQVIAIRVLLSRAKNQSAVDTLVKQYPGMLSQADVDLAMALLAPTKLLVSQRKKL